MTGQPSEHSERGFDRLIFFSDAVVAIAITLVVLPLVDTARDLQDRPASAWLRESTDGLLAAGISFVVIGMFWRDHHRLFERATGYSPRVIWANFAWLVGVTALPVVTVVDVAAPRSDRVALGLYLGTIFYLMIMIRIEELLLAAAGLLGAERVTGRLLMLNALPVVLVLIAFVITQLVPRWDLLPLLLLLLARPLRRLLNIVSQHASG